MKQQQQQQNEEPKKTLIFFLFVDAKEKFPGNSFEKIDRHGIFSE